MPYLLHFDVVMLKQIISNLISNAAKYTDKGTVTFSLDYEKIDNDFEYLTVHIKDTGIGVKPEDQKKLFIDFERFDEKNHRTTQGSGLGLSIVQRLLNMNDSKLEFVSEYGVGSDFYFTIKINVRDWATVSSHKSEYESEIIKNNHYHESFKAPEANVLVVDDVDVNRFVFRSLLKNTELKITEAAGGQEALDLCRQHRYDLIFMDHLMPDMDGIVTFHALREMDQEWTHTVPVIALTANAISGARQMYLDEGFIDYLSKPISPTYLESKLIQYLPEDKVRIIEKERDEKATVNNLLQKKNMPLGLDELGVMPQISEVDIISGLSAIYEKLISALHAFREGYQVTKKESDTSQSDISGIEENNQNVDVDTIQPKGESKDMSTDPIGHIGEIRKLNSEEMSKVFAILKQKADEFDFDSCEKLVDFLTAQSVSNKMKTTLTEVKNALEDIDWDKVQSLIADF